MAPKLCRVPILWRDGVPVRTGGEEQEGDDPEPEGHALRLRDQERACRIALVSEAPASVRRTAASLSLSVMRASSWR